MLKRTTLFCILGVLVLSLAGCGAPPAPVEEEEEAAPPPEPPPPVYELTEQEVTVEEPAFTSRNISVLGIKVGDVTRSVEENLGDVVNTRTGDQDYITAYQNGGLVIHTFKLTGKARKIEITSFFADELADEKLKSLLKSGDLDEMRELLGEEQGTEEIADANETDYIYADRGIRFIQYDVQGQTINAIRFEEYRDASGNT